jgi:hypothetical protein
MVRRPVLITVVGSIIGATTLALAAPAWAFSQNDCSIGVTKPKIKPALDCLEITSSADGLYCGAGLYVHNTCNNAIETVGFKFSGCSRMRENGVPLEAPDPSVISTNYTCTLWLLVDKLGVTPYEYHLTQNGTDYTVTFQANVASFNDPGCFCSVPGLAFRSGSHKNFLSTLGVGVLALGLSLRRRKRRAPK